MHSTTSTTAGKPVLQFEGHYEPGGGTQMPRPRPESPVRRPSEARAGYLKTRRTEKPRRFLQREHPSLPGNPGPGVHPPPRTQRPLREAGAGSQGRATQPEPAGCKRGGHLEGGRIIWRRGRRRPSQPAAPFRARGRREKVTSFKSGFSHPTSPHGPPLSPGGQRCEFCAHRGPPVQEMQSECRLVGSPLLPCAPVWGCLHV